MSDLVEFLVVLLGVGFALFVLAWFTVLPTLGLFYLFGWLA